MHMSWEPATLLNDAALSSHAALLHFWKGASMTVDATWIVAIATEIAARHASNKLQCLNFRLVRLEEVIMGTL